MRARGQWRPAFWSSNCRIVDWQTVDYQTIDYQTKDYRTAIAVTSSFEGKSLQFRLE